MNFHSSDGRESGRSASPRELPPTAAARTICYAAAVAMDIATRATDAKVRGDAAARGALLTPIAKAFSTDIGNEVSSLGMQIHGGMGFMEETGAAQHFRDARITAIYEGTNGIQSIDLLTRKLAANGGAAVWTVLGALFDIIGKVEVSNDPAFGTTGAKLRDVGSLERTSKWLLKRVTSAPNEALAGATPYLRLFGSTFGGCMLASEALAARDLGDGLGDPARYVTLARFFAENISVLARSLERTVLDNAEARNGADAYCWDSAQVPCLADTSCAHLIFQHRQGRCGPSVALLHLTQLYVTLSRWRIDCFFHPFCVSHRPEYFGSARCCPRTPFDTTSTCRISTVRWTISHFTSGWRNFRSIVTTATA
jgi:hypothetical protein